VAAGTSAAPVPRAPIWQRDDPPGNVEPVDDRAQMTMAEEFLTIAAERQEKSKVLESPERVA
jgi:hypothetical protein